MEATGEAQGRAGGEPAKRRHRDEAESSPGVDDDPATPPPPPEQISEDEDDYSTDHHGEVFLPQYQTDEEIMEEYRLGWECRRHGMFIGFQDETTISCMLTTYKDVPDASVSRTLQVYSIKVDKANLGWPLRVYGMVAARDHVDYNRNFLFNRTSDNCQIITADEPYLTLTGPSRAILFLEPVDFEVDSKFKRESEDENALINQVLWYQRYPGPLGTILHNNLCTIRFHCKQFRETVEATILRVQIIRGSWPGRSAGKVFCRGAASSLEEFVLLAFPDGDSPPVDRDGNVHLSRRVASVDVNQGFKVSVQAYSACGSLKVPIATGDAVFKHQQDGVTEKECDLGDSCRVKIKVAWSLLTWSELLLRG